MLRTPASAVSRRASPRTSLRRTGSSLPATAPPPSPNALSRPLHRNASSSSQRLHDHYSSFGWTAGRAATAAAVLAATAYCSLGEPLRSDAPPPGPNPVQEIVTPVTLSQQDQMWERAQKQGLFAWGSNRYNVVAPDSPTTTLVKTPRSIPFFDGMALRDVVLEEKHGVAVDAYGDVLQWGLGFFDSTSRAVPENIEEAPLGRRREKERANELFPKGSEAARPRDPVKTLVGKDIVRIAASDEKVYALSRKGDVYVFAARQDAQSPRSPSSGSWSANPLTLFGALSRGETIDFEKLQLAPSVKLGRGDRIAEIAAGSSHLLALSKEGRTFSLPIDAEGNAFGQLGSRKVLLNAPTVPSSKPSHVEALLDPRLMNPIHEAQQPPSQEIMPWTKLPKPSERVKSVPKPQARVADTPDGAQALTEPPTSIRYCTTLSEIPSLRQVRVSEIAVGNEHNLARTPEGRVLAWGRHTHGQLGLGSGFSIECIPVPSEVVLAKCFSNGTRDVRCLRVAAGGDNSFFVTDRKEDGRMGTGQSVDVLAAGKGQWGTLGNALWSQVKPEPGRVKTVSGLMEYSEATNKVHPVPIHTLSVGRPGHVALVLDTVESQGHTAFGRDVMVFGHNAAYQLGTGKRSNLAVPQHLHPLPPPTPSAPISAEGIIADATKALPAAAVPAAAPAPTEADVNSGALTHMPHNRLQLASQTKADTRGAPTSASAAHADAATASFRYADGKVKKGVLVEETISAGTVSMAVWWKCAV